MVASGEDRVSLTSIVSLGTQPLSAPQTPQQVLVVKAPPFALLAQVGRMIAQQGVKGAAKTAMTGAGKKVGELASKEGMKQLAQEGAKKVTSKEGMEQAMNKLKESQQKREMERAKELMEAGKGGASVASTTMGS